ncbi:unnamed protein product [Arabidopsis thaliana]|uniref:Uncharacterized protein n=1 Tax=Arabidopsis thaliana TaxID=3702 RepID=A0A654GBN6_ARATH|nr:unnamed protein product [Arabidopsis thaliana]
MSTPVSYVKNGGKQNREPDIGEEYNNHRRRRRLQWALSISLYLRIESSLCNFSCCLNLLMKSEAFASTPSSPSPKDVDLSTLVVSGLLRSTDSTVSGASAWLPAKPKPDFSLADFVIFVKAFFFFFTGFFDSDLLRTCLCSS